MNLSENLSRIIQEKDILIDKYRKELEKFAIDFQTKSFDSIVNNVISQLDTENGIIQNTPKNIRLISELDSTVRQLQTKQFPELLKSLSTNFNKLSSLNNLYFTEVVGISELVKKASENAIKTMAVRLGVKASGELEVSGWMSSLIKDRTVLDGVKQIVFKSVVGQSKFSDTLNDLKTYVEGTPEKGGAYEKYMKNSLYDIYQQYDAAYSQTMANDLELKYFVYTGGLVQDSRDFCREHNDHVYTTEDAQSWPTWTPSKAVNIATFEQKDIYAIPSYIGYPGYNPLIDRGGYNCRHQLSYISKELAIKLGYEEKTESINQNQIKTVDEIVTENEQSIRNNANFETAIVFDKNGKIINKLVGSETSITLPQPSEMKFVDTIFTHNHPRGAKYPIGDMKRIGNSFSIQDVRSAAMQNMQEIRAVTPEFTFVLQRPSFGWPSDLTLKEAYERHNSAVFKMFNERLNNNITTVNKCETVHYHEVMKRLAKELGINYFKIRI